MSLENVSLVTMRLALSLVSVSLLANCGSKKQFSTLDGAIALKSSGLKDPNLREPAAVVPPTDDKRGVKDPNSTREGICGNYPLYPRPLSGVPDASQQMRASIITMPKAGITEAYSFSIYNASNLTSGWVPLSAGLPLDRYSAVMNVEVPANSKNPVVLKLDAYEPTVWRIHDPAGRVRFVDVSGYHCQTVEGALNAVISNQSLEGGSKHAVASPIEGLLIKSQYVYEGASINFTFTAGI